MAQKILVLDFGGQYNQLIARRVRECGVYCEIMPYSTDMETIREYNASGLILTGGPGSVYETDAPKADTGIFDLGIPILGICYGCQFIAHMLGGEVIPAQSDKAREYGKTLTSYDVSCPLFKGVPEEGISWMSHGDYLDRMPGGFKVAARSDACPNAAIYDRERAFYGVQFHPEVNHTENGRAMLRNFLYEICGLSGDWTMGSFREKSVERIREQVGDGRVLLALSGGVDSSVCAALISETIGKQLTCVFVDHGLLRKNEADEVEAAFADRDLNFVRIDASQRFLGRLKGITEPERKRKIIGEEFIRVFEEESGKLGEIEFLAQGTIYPDVIESGAGSAAVIKSHHNVGGLPENIGFKGIIEPLNTLFKDEVRQLGRELGLPEDMVSRKPFPGPGLAIRIIGEITEEKLAMLREADFIFRSEIKAAGLEGMMSQYFAALTNMRSVGVMGDGRSYDHAVALRAVSTDDFMTADWVRIPYELLDRISVRIVNEVSGINRVFYDITSKPPATIEYE